MGGGGVAMEASQVQTQPGQMAPPGKTCPSPSSAPLGPHPACAAHGIHLWVLNLKCLSCRVWYSLYSWSNSRNVYLHAHRRGQWHPPSDCHSGDRAALQAAETHLNSSKKRREMLHLIPVCPLPERGQEGFFPCERGKGCCVLSDEAARLKTPH